MSLGMSGKRHSEKTKKKMRKARLERKELLGYINSPKTRKRISEAQRDKKLSWETKIKISLALRGKKKPPFTEEHRKRLSEAWKERPRPWNKGKKCHFWRGGMMEKIPVKCTMCEKINLIRKGRFLKLNQPYRCLSCSLKRRIITPETRRKLSLAHRKYSLDESFFEKIDNEKKAYWLGFLAGDCAITDENRLKLRLALKDKKHLQRFKKIIKWNGRDYFPKHQDALEVNFRSLKIIKDLANYFITSQKTYSIQFPNLPKPLERHFIRGVFDADGCINKAVRINRGKSGQIYICL